ncbi:MAG: nucleoside monophosphate kinase [Holosporaceae bacterium]|jgi:adenylate kinase|nr:nucleoside monophosphate kinase [Holosporaceae bacterium]
MRCCCGCKKKENESVPGTKDTKGAKSVKIVVLLGAPGAGKGTVAQYLLDNYDVVHFSTGNLLRNEVKNDTELGREVSAYVGSGGLVNDDIINKVVELNLAKTLESGSAILLDGYPRSVDQAKFLDQLDSGSLRDAIRIIEIDVESEVVVARLFDRKICSKCGATFGRLDVIAECSRCGGAFVKRPDDEEVVIRRRLQEYKSTTMPVSEYYGSRLLKVNGDRSPDEVARGVTDVFRDFGVKKRR